MKELISFSAIKKLYEKNNYRFFTGINDINLFGIRGSERRVNKFDDLIGVLYRTSDNKELIAYYPATVDPGYEWLVKPMNAGGAAAIAPGQYRGVWQMGWFKGTRALRQVGNFRIYRDNNKDAIFDYDVDTIMKSTYVDGIFLHEHFQKADSPTTVSTSSAGCVVPQSRSNHIKLFTHLDKQINQGLGDKFTFTLFDESEFYATGR